jgi:hypothetical protein
MKQYNQLLDDEIIFEIKLLFKVDQLFFIIKYMFFTIYYKLI